MNRSIVCKSLIWRFLERIGAQAVTLLVSVVLARLLDPSSYGEIAIVTVVITILQVFVDSGLGNALIQKKDADDIDFSSVFFFNLGFSFLLYIALFFGAPLISDYYNMASLISPIRVLGIVVIVSGIKNTQQAYVAKHMLFKKFFFATLSGTILAAIMGIVMAYKGYGVWALIFQHLINIVVDTAILWLTVKWRPKRCFSFNRIKELFSFGWKLLFAQLITVTYSNIRQLIIGRQYDSSSLGFYNQGEKIPGLIVNNINTSIDSVLFPSLSSAQELPETIKNMTRRAIKTSSYVMMPLMMILSTCAEPLVRLVLTEKWLPCVPFLRVFCLIYAFYPIHTANLNAIMAMGRSNIYLKLEIIKDMIGVVVILITFQISAFAIAVGYLIATLVATVINAWPNNSLIGYSYFAQLKDIMPSIFLSVLSGLVIILLNLIPLPDLLKLILQIITGLGIYMAASVFFKLDTFNYLMGIFDELLKKKGDIEND